MNANQHLDYDALNALKDVMEDDFGFLIQTFLQDSSNRLASFNALLSSEPFDSDAIRRTAHSFKGSCSNLGALHLATLCSAVERKALAREFTSLSIDVANVEAEFLIVKQKMLDFLG